MDCYIESDFEYQGGFQLMSSTNSSTTGPCDSSFSSSASSYEECFTPSRRGSSGVLDIDELPFCRSFFSSTGMNSPVDDVMFYPMPSMSLNNKPEMLDLSEFYMTPCKSTSNCGMANYNSSQVNNSYSSGNPKPPLESLPEMSFDSLPGLLFDDSTSPLHMNSSPSDFVIPSQTFLSESYRPSTPMQDMSRTMLTSPLASCGQPPPSIGYFMSPREMQTQTSRSSTSARSIPTACRNPPNSALESSATLHRVQSLGSSRVRKRQVKAKIDRVPAALFHCDFEGCKSERKKFKRHEHLKRHQRTHTDNRQIPCQFCPKSFQQDRRDNFKAHVALHTIPKEVKKGSRTSYSPKAQAVYDALCSKKRGSADKLHGPHDGLKVLTRSGRSSKTPSGGTQ